MLVEVCYEWALALSLFQQNVFQLPDNVQFLMVANWAWMIFLGILGDTSPTALLSSSELTFRFL